MPKEQNKKKLPKSSSDSVMGGSGGRQAARSIPRSKTFGSKLRMPSKKTLKAAQLAKVGEYYLKISLLYI